MTGPPRWPDGSGTSGTPPRHGPRAWLSTGGSPLAPRGPGDQVRPTPQRSAETGITRSAGSTASAQSLSMSGSAWADRTSGRLDPAQRRARARWVGQTPTRPMTFPARAVLAASRPLEWRQGAADPRAQNDSLSRFSGKRESAPESSASSKGARSQIEVSPLGEAAPAPALSGGRPPARSAPGWRAPSGRRSFSGMRRR
jgi:hypothetical protein